MKKISAIKHSVFWIFSKRFIIRSYSQIAIYIRKNSFLSFFLFYSFCNLWTTLYHAPFKEKVKESVFNRIFFMYFSCCKICTTLTLYTHLIPLKWRSHWQEEFQKMTELLSRYFWKSNAKWILEPIFSHDWRKRTSQNSYSYNVEILLHFKVNWKKKLTYFHFYISKFQSLSPKT